MSAHGQQPVHTREQILAATARPFPRALLALAGALALLGTITFVAGLFLDPARAWRALLLNWNFFTPLASAGIMIVATQRITSARWSRAVIRFMEGYAAFLPIAFALLLLMVLVGKDHIFPWTHEEITAHEREIYFIPAFFITRVLVAFGLITILSLWFVYTSVRLDVGGAPEWGAGWARGLRRRMRRHYGEERREIFATHSRQGWLAVLLAFAWGFGWIVLAFDLSMTLDLHFESTIYGWWFFMGGWLAALMLFALLVIAWRRFLGVPELIGEPQFHDIGKLCFAFTAFWGYLTFSQYLIVWYGNLAFETHWFRLRLIPPWQWLSLAVVFLAFVIPFFGLLSRAAKVFLPTLGGFAIVSLAGIWLLRYVEAYPSLYYPTDRVVLGVWELGVALGYAGLFALSYIGFMSAFPRMRVVLMTSPFRDEVQVPYDPETLEPLPAHE